MKPVLDQEGFSMIEVLISMGILAIGLLAIMSLQLTSIGFNTGSNITTIADMVAQKRIEEIASGRINDVTSLVSNITGEENPIIEEHVNTDGSSSQSGIFRRQTWILEDSSSSSIRRVKVNVSWTKGGSPKSVTYSVLTRGL